MCYYLKSVNYDGRLHFVVEISKAEDYFFTRFLFSWDQSYGLKTGERPENMCNFALCGIKGNTFDIDSVSSIEGNWNDVRSKDILDTTDKVSGLPFHRGGRHRKGGISILNRLKNVV